MLWGGPTRMLSSAVTPLQRRRLRWPWLLLGLLPGRVLAGGAQTRADPPQVDFCRDVRPILAEHCFACHGPDSAARQAGLRLDRRDAALAAGAILPGRPQESPLVRRIAAEVAEEVMPPPSTHKQLTRSACNSAHLDRTGGSLPDPLVADAAAPAGGAAGGLGSMATQSARFLRARGSGGQGLGPSS